MWWDEERIRWYRKAAEGSGFHRDLATAIEKHLDKNDRILELGCGLGYVSQILAEDGYRITATDNDNAALAEAEKRSGFEIFSYLDATGIIPESDVLLLLFFGRLTENGNFERYMRNTQRIIYVISEHRGQSDNLRKRANEPEETLKWLEGQRGIRVKHYPFSSPFPQPLSSREDAKRYISRMYGNDKIEKYMAYLKKTKEGFLLPNMKHSTIFTIDKEEK